MANYTNLKNLIDQNITTNGQGDITGAILNSTLKDIIDTIASGFLYNGIATPDGNPGTIDANVFFFALQAGTYANYGDLEITDGISIITYNGSWNAVNLLSVSGSLIQRVEEINSKIQQSSIFMGLGAAEQGFYERDGSSWRFFADSNFRTLSYSFPCVPGERYFYSGFAGARVICAQFFDYQNNIIGDFRPAEGFKLYENIEIDIPQNAAYARFYSSFNVNTSPNDGFYFKVNEIIDDIIITEHDGYLLASGAYNDTTNYHSLSTNHIRCSEGDIFYYKGRGINLARSYLMYNGSTIVSYGSINNKDVPEMLPYKITIPANVTSVVFSSYENKSNPDLQLFVFRQEDYFKSTLANVSAKLYRKSINFLGDSYVANHGQSYDLTWCHLIAQKYAMTDRNYGINGNGIVSGNNPMSSRYTSMDSNADYVIVVGGTNDFNAQPTLATFKTNLKAFIKNLRQKYPVAKIAFFTPWNDDGEAQPYPVPSGAYNSLTDYANAIAEVCASLGIACHNSAIKASIQSWSSGMRSEFFQSSTDHSHLNENGHKYFMNDAEAFLLSL